MIDVSIDVNDDDAQALMRQMDRAIVELRKPLQDVLRWTAYAWTRSLGAATRVSEKIRPIVRNPDRRYLTDRRRAPFGVMAYRNGEQVFKPIFRTGEHGSRRFYDPKTVSWFEHWGPNKNKWRKVASGQDPANPEIIVPGIMTDRRRKIGRSGLAKKSWTRIQSKLTGGGTASAMDVPVVGFVQWRGGGEVTVTNDLDYARSAMNGGESAITRAAASAASWLNERVNQELRKRLLK
jgi:hypothetical protein